MLFVFDFCNYTKYINNNFKNNRDFEGKHNSFYTRDDGQIVFDYY